MRQTLDKFETSPDSGKTLFDYFGQTYEYDSVKNNPIFQAFNAKCRKLNELCKNMFLDIGEAQVIYRKKWSNIRYCDFETVEEWFRNNHRRVIQILNPDMHEECMKQIEYKTWFERG